MSPPCRFLKVSEEATRNPSSCEEKREVFALSATYPLIEVPLKINRSIWHPLLEKNRPKAKAKDTVSSFPKTGKQHLTLWPATHLPRSNHRLLWAAIMHTPHSSAGHVFTPFFYNTSFSLFDFIVKGGCKVKKQITQQSSTGSSLPLCILFILNFPLEPAEEAWQREPGAQKTHYFSR